MLGGSLIHTLQFTSRHYFPQVSSGYYSQFWKRQCRKQSISKGTEIALSFLHCPLQDIVSLDLGWTKAVVAIYYQRMLPWIGLEACILNTNDGIKKQASKQTNRTLKKFCSDLLLYALLIKENHVLLHLCPCTWKSIKGVCLVGNAV